MEQRVQGARNRGYLIDNHDAKGKNKGSLLERMKNLKTFTDRHENNA